jgi:hypothetical protein
MLVSLPRFRDGNPISMDCTAGSRDGRLITACDSLPRSWLGRLLDAVGGWVFRADDRAAIQYGWQITTHHGGLSRSYRDPRFDTLHACPRCNGSGGRDDAPCVPCDGTGRVSRAVSYPEGQLR